MRTHAVLPARRTACTRVAMLFIAALATASCHSAQTPAPAATPVTTRDLGSIRNVVVIYAENRSFDALYGLFPGANGLSSSADRWTQLDRNGAPLRELPPVWNGLTARGRTPVVTQAQTEHLPNAPFAIDDPAGFNASIGVTTRDLVHRFYEHQMQINGGRNDRFVAYGDSGALVMGHYDGRQLPLWNIARAYTLADNFFMAAFGGSFLNHFWLVCACTPTYPSADRSPARSLIAELERDGLTLRVAANSPASALEGPPRFVRSGNLTPDFFAVNTMQPPYLPSANRLPAGSGSQLADPAAATTLPPQTGPHIGRMLSERNVTWAWYAGGWGVALGGAAAAPVSFQYHHQPLNYFADLAPGTAARDEHLRDGGVAGAGFIADIDAGRLPAVAFYKPQGTLNEHAGYTDVLSGDRHMADLVAHLEKSPQWPGMLVIITYDENGGFWDHVAPPIGDRWGPGTRIPAIIVSPFARRGFVDHTLYDTTSIARFLTRRFDLTPLPGIVARDAAIAAKGAQPIGDLTNALALSPDAVR